MKMRALNLAHHTVLKALDGVVLQLNVHRQQHTKLNAAKAGEQACLNASAAALRDSGSLSWADLQGIQLIRHNQATNNARIDRAIQQIEPLIQELSTKRDTLLARCKALELLIERQQLSRQKAIAKTEQREMDEWINHSIRSD